MTVASFTPCGWLVYRIKDGDIEIFGVMESEAKARDDIAVLERTNPDQKWQTKIVWFIGWGMSMPVSNDDRAGNNGAN